MNLLVFMTLQVLNLPKQVYLLCLMVFSDYCVKWLHLNGYHRRFDNVVKEMKAQTR